MPPAAFYKKTFKSSEGETLKLRRASMQATPASPQNIFKARPETAPPGTLLRNYATATISSNLHSKATKRKAERSFPAGKISFNVCDGASAVGISDLPHTDVEVDTAIAEGVAPEQPSKAIITVIPQSTIKGYTSDTAPIHPQQTPKIVQVAKRASLMGIPLELRIMIFKYLFPPGKPQGPSEITLYCGPPLRVLGHSNGQLCRVNSQIYEETKELLYGQTFVFLSREALKDFSASRTPQQLSHLKAICLKSRITDWTDAIKTLLLPPAASLTVHWYISRRLWEALVTNKSLDYREVRLIPGLQEQVVVFEPLSNKGDKTPSYEFLETIFAPEA